MSEIEIRQLKELLKGVREERDYLFNKLSTEKLWLQQENTQLKEQRSKAIEYIKKCTSSQDVIAHFLGYTEVKELMKILESNKED